MLVHSRRPHHLTLWPIALPVLLAASAASAQEVPAAQPAEAALVEALREGGYILYMRHASTEKDYADQVSAVMGDCSTQRTLSAEGWQEAKSIGAAIETLAIPVGEVFSSEYCRAWQTAEIAFGRHVARADLNFEPAEEYSPEQIQAMKARIHALLGRSPSPGYNLVYVGHDDPFEAATGIYPEPQGVIHVVKPGEGGSFNVLGSIAPDAWAGLLQALD